MATRRRVIVRTLAFWASLCLLAGFPSAGLGAVASAPAWKLEQSAMPSTLEPGSSAAHYGAAAESAPKLRVTAVNVGGAPFGNAVIRDVLPVGLKPVANLVPKWQSYSPERPPESGSASETRFRTGPCLVLGQEVICEVPFAILPGNPVVAFIPLEVGAIGSTSVSNEIAVEGAGGGTVVRHVPTPIGQVAPSFGFPPSEEEGLGGGAFDLAGTPERAGAHPFIVEVNSKVNSKLLGAGTNFAEIRPVQALRNIAVSLPAGLVVNPRATPVRCAKVDFEVYENYCPAASQVGTVTFDLFGGLESNVAALYNLVPEPGVPAEFGFAITGATVVIRGGLSGDFRLTAGSSEILSRYAIDGVRTQLWGNPSDSRHDQWRNSLLPGEACLYGCSTPADKAPFLTMPSACSPSMEFDGSATSWERSTASRTEVFRTVGGEPERVEGCEELSFSPVVAIKPITSAATTDAAASPSGLDFGLKVPQNSELQGLATATVKKVVVELPEGMSVNPPAANGLTGCSLGQIGLGENTPPDCPAASRVGTAEITTPLLPSPLNGSIYLAEQRNNPFGTLLGLYLAVEGEGIVIKLPGRVDVDSQTGQVKATFDNNPQLPFETLNVHLNSGPRAALVTPSKCGAYVARTEVTPWSSSTPVVLETPISVSQNCSNDGFNPGFVAGSTSPTAGRYSSFDLRVTREDGEQNLSRITSTLPEGLLAKLAGVPLCSDAQAVTGDCPGASQIGTVVTGVGAGALPLYLPQPGKDPTAVYLAGPYKGGPYSLVVKVPAQAGPFDLGTIAVRAAIDVDPFTAKVSVSSDPLPQIFEGIPVAYRDVRVDVNRPEFVRNPTSCESMQVMSSLVSSAGTTATPSSHFQVTGCSSLAFKPQLKLSLTGSTKRAGHPGLKAVLTYPKNGDFANIGRAQVNLPHSEFLDQSNLNKTCTRPVLLEGKCPRTTVYGKAKAWTPLLDRPLEGPVFLVGGFGYKLPAMVAELGGQIRVLLAGKVDTGPNKGIRNTFEMVPDAPVSRFVLELKGGRQYSLLENSENLCRKPQRGIARLNGQNGAVQVLHPLIENQCRMKHRHSKASAGKGAGNKK